MKKTALLIYIILTVGFGAPIFAAEITVQTAVEKNTVMVGEPFVWQITVNGTTAATLPAIEELRKIMPDFNCLFLGERPQSMNSVTIINGKRTEVNNRSVVIQYQLTAQRVGTLNLPAINFTADGVAVKTQPLILRVTTATNTPNFDLMYVLPRAQIYVGETFAVPVTLFFNGNINSVQFTLPFAQSPQFFCQFPQTPTGAENEIQIPVNGQLIIARHGERQWQGRNRHAVFFNFLLRAKSVGTFELAAPTATGQHGGDGLFSRSERFYALGKAQTLTVRELPTTNQPANFSGLIGDYKIAATLDPATAAVGDPLTFTVVVTGSDNLTDVTLPELNKIPEFAARFKIPPERAEGKIINGAKVFTQTLRALNAEVKEVPPLSLNYFNPQSEQYATVTTAKIPVTINAAKIVGVADLEGYGGDTATKLASEKIGLAPNYVNPDCLTPSLLNPRRATQMFADWQWAILIALPSLYLLLRIGESWRARRTRTADARRAQQALAIFRHELMALQNRGESMAELLTILRNYFAARWHLSAAALTYADVVPYLPTTAPETLKTLQEIFNLAELARYAPTTAGRITGDFAVKLLNVLEQVD